MIDPISIGFMAVGAGTSIASAFGSNSAAKAAEKAQKKAMQAQERAIRQQAEQQRRQVLAQAHQLRSTLRTAAGESGIGYGGTYLDVLRQTNLDEGLNLTAIAENTRNAAAALQSRFQPLQRTNPLMAGLAGGIQGLQLGADIAGSLARIQTTNMGWLPNNIPTASWSGFSSAGLSPLDKISSLTAGFSF